MSDRLGGIQEKWIAGESAGWGDSRLYRMPECFYEVGIEVLHPLFPKEPVEELGICAECVDVSDPLGRMEYRFFRHLQQF